MDDAKRTLLAKIAKLLEKRVDRGCTPEEAASAAILAERLLIEHGLSLSDVTAIPEASIGMAQSGYMSPEREGAEWLACLVLSVSDICNVQGLIRKIGERSAFAWVGEEVDVLTAEALFVFFIQNAQQACAESYADRLAWFGKGEFTVFLSDFWSRVQRKDAEPATAEDFEKVPTQFKADFLMGYATQIRERVRSRIPPAMGKEIVRHKSAEIESYLLERANGPVGEHEAKPALTQDPNAFMDGMAAASDVPLGLNKALEKTIAP